jgi:hypothetical protein
MQEANEGGMTMNQNGESLVHQVPVGLDVRPQVSLRPAPGIAVRVPTRVVLIGGGGIILGCLALMLGVGWETALPGCGGATALLIGLSEGRIGGYRPLVWALAVVRHRQRPPVLR